MPSKPSTITRLTFAGERLQPALHMATASAPRSSNAVDLGRVTRGLREQRLAIHVRRRLDAELLQRGRGDVDQGRIVAIDGAIAEQHTRHQFGIHTVVATPALGVIFKDRCGDTTFGTIP